MASSGQGLDWAGYVDWLVAEHGTLAAAADRLAADRSHADRVESVERALRRLRGRGQQDGGQWGVRCLRTFGVPVEVTARLRWMGHYHSRFTDLPVPLCLDLLRLWDRPPVSASPARAWLQLGLASVALRREDRATARATLQRVAEAEAAARAERALVVAFIDSRERPDAVAAHLAEAEGAIAEVPVGDDRACLWARLVDHRGHTLNVERRDHEAAYALYVEIPAEGPPFAQVRRHNGLGWSALKLGRRDEAVEHARIAVSAAGDAGLLRLRAMALQLLARAVGCEAGAPARARAAAIAEQLQDETLRTRTQHR